MKTLILLIMFSLLAACEDSSKAREKLEKGVEVAKQAAETAKKRAPEVDEAAEKVKKAANKVKEKAKKVEDRAADFVLPVDKAERLGDRMSQEILAESTAVEGPLAEYVRDLGEGIVDASGDRPEGISYDFWVIRDEAINAFAIPGGHIFVTTGLLQKAENEAELVAVLGHEVAHVIERHVAEGMVARYGVSVLTAIALGRNSEELEQIVAEIIGKGLLLKHSRDDEREADELGLQLAVAAGHSPMGHKTFFEKIAEGTSVPALVSTHPDPGKRAEAAAKRISALESQIRERSLHRERYQKAVAKL